MSDVNASGHATAKRAALIAVRHGYEVPTAVGRKNLAMAFAGQGCVVYGKAFDCLRVAGTTVQLHDLSDVERRIRDITLCEIKSTRKAAVRPDFGGYFFSISTAEILVAQSLGSQFRFLFVNTMTETVLDLSLQEVYARAKAIYPSWSIQF